jgi:hypothetical protein
MSSLDAGRAPAGLAAPHHWRGLAACAAVALVCAPFTVAAIVGFPLWDDASIWLLIDEQGIDALAESQPDRPVMAALWHMLAPSREIFWTAAFVAQAAAWPLLAYLAGQLWTALFPARRRYAAAVGCLAVAPALVRVQPVTVNVALASLLTVVVAYAALVAVLRVVLRPGRSPALTLALAVPLLGFATLVQEYAAAATAAMGIVLGWFALGGRGPAIARRARQALVVLVPTVGLSYAAYVALSDERFRRDLHPEHVVSLGLEHAVKLPVIVVGLLPHAAGGALRQLAEVGWHSRLSLVATAYGALVGALLVVATGGVRRRPRALCSRELQRGAVLVLALTTVLVSALAMGRVPWDPDDGMTTRYAIPALPIAAALSLFAALAFVQPRLVVAVVGLVGLAIGRAAFLDAGAAVEEARLMRALGEAVHPHVDAGPGYTVAAVRLPERGLGPARQWELTARLAADWPRQTRARFWAYRFGDEPSLGYREEARRVFGERGECAPPSTIDVEIRLVTRRGPVDRLLYVEPRHDGGVTVEDYCVGPSTSSSAPRPAGARDVAGRTASHATTSTTSSSASSR